MDEHMIVTREVRLNQLALDRFNAFRAKKQLPLLEEGEVANLLYEHGFELRSHYTPEDMERMYFSSDGKVLRRVNGTHCVAVANLG